MQALGRVATMVMHEPSPAADRGLHCETDGPARPSSGPGRRTMGHQEYPHGTACSWQRVPRHFIEIVEFFDYSRSTNISIHAGMAAHVAPAREPGGTAAGGTRLTQPPLFAAISAETCTCSCPSRSLSDLSAAWSAPPRCSASRSARHSWPSAAAKRAVSGDSQMHPDSSYDHAAVEPHAVDVLARDDAETIVLDFVDP